MTFRVLIAGATGQVGSAVVRALLASSECKEVVAVVRKTGVLDERVRQVVLDSAASTFESDVTKLGRSCAELGEPLYGVSCIGIGKGSAKWSEEDMTKLEVGVVGSFARGCLAAGIERFGLLSAAGSTPTSRIKYARVMGKKEEAVKAVGFPQLSIFVLGSSRATSTRRATSPVLGRLIPGSYGTIDQDEIGRAFVRELSNGAPGVKLLENGAMKALARA